MKRGTLIVLGAFAVLLVIALATREKHVNAGVPKLELPTLDKSQVTEIAVSGPFNAVLKKGPSGWTVSDPKGSGKSYATDEVPINAALDAVADLRAQEFVSARADRLAEFELDDAKALRVKITAEGLGPVEVLYGKADAAGAGTYLKVADRPEIFLGPPRLAWALRKAPSAWRKKQFLNLPADQLTQVTLSHGDGSSLSLKPAAQGTGWELAEPSALPKGFRFDPAAAERVAKQVTSMFAQDFSEAAADTSAHTVTVQTKEGSSVVLHVGAPANGTVPVTVEGDPQVYLVAEYLAASATKRLDDLRDTTLMTFDVAKVKRLSIEALGKRTVAAREGTTWKLVEPKAPPATFDPEQVTTQLAYLRNLRAQRADSSPAAQKACAQKPSATVELELDGAPRQQLRFFGDLTPNEICAQGSADNLTYVVTQNERFRFGKGAELFNKPAPPPNLQGMQGLEQLPPEVRAQLEAQLRNRPH